MLLAEKRRRKATHLRSTPIVGCQVLLYSSSCVANLLGGQIYWKLQLPSSCTNHEATQKAALSNAAVAYNSTPALASAYRFCRKDWKPAVGRTLTAGRMRSQRPSEQLCSEANVRSGAAFLSNRTHRLFPLSTLCCLFVCCC